MYLKEALEDLYICATNAKNATLEEGYYEKCYDRVIEELEAKDTEINKLNNVIDKMAELIYETWLDDDNAIAVPINKVPEMSDKEEIKEYFMKE